MKCQGICPYYVAYFCQCWDPALLLFMWGASLLNHIPGVFLVSWANTPQYRDPSLQSGNLFGQALTCFCLYKHTLSLSIASNWYQPKWPYFGRLGKHLSAHMRICKCNILMFSQALTQTELSIKFWIFYSTHTRGHGCLRSHVNVTYQTVHKTFNLRVIGVIWCNCV